MIQQKIQALTAKIDRIQQDESTEANLIREMTMRKALQEELKREELLWKHKSRVTWLTTKDLNTKFFHLSTIIRRRRNAIEFLTQNGRGCVAWGKKGDW